MTTFSPLTLSGRPLFYYIHFPAKKGGLSTRRGEMNVVSVRRPFYPPSTRLRWLYTPQYRPLYPPLYDNQPTYNISGHLSPRPSGGG